MSDSGRQPFGFETTQWSLILSAGKQTGDSHNDSLQDLCQRYWRPLYLFVRRNGHACHQAEDAVQAFFLHLIDGNALQVADQTRGRFRTFLLSALENFLHNEHAKSIAIKRGGTTPILSLDIRDAEGTLVNQPADFGTPEDEFHRQWALTVMQEVLDGMRTEYESRGKTALFDALAPYLSLESRQSAYAKTAEHLRMTTSAVKVAVHRLRREYRHRLRIVVASTVQTEDDVQDELQVLLQALAR